jgi:hypothetical protein
MPTTLRTWARDYAAAEQALITGSTLTEPMVDAIVGARSDITVTTGCDAGRCDRDPVAACLRTQTPEARVARYALTGWGADRGADTDWYEVRDYNPRHRMPIEPLQEQGHASPLEAVHLLALTVTKGEHLDWFQQRLWFYPRLILVTTQGAEGRVHHAIAPIGN